MTELLYNVCRWLVGEEDAKAVGGVTTNQPPTAFDQRAFMETIGVVTATIAWESNVATTIAQTSATVGQGGSSNLQRFKAHHPPTFKGGGEPMEADHWFRKVCKILEAMRLPSMPRG